MRTVVAMHQTDELGEPELVDFAKDKKFEETVAALSLLCGVPIETADRLMAGDRPDPILILCKAAGYGWDTVRAIIMSRPSAKGTSSQSLDAVLRQLRAAVGVDRAARGAVLAGQPARRQTS